MLVGGFGSALASEVDIVVSDRSAVYQEAVSAVRQEMVGAEATTFPVPDNVQRRPSPPRLVVALGTRALHYAAQAYPDTPIVASMVTRAAYEKFRSQLPRERRAITVVFVDQPFSRQVNLIRTVLPGKTRLGVLTSPESERDLADLRAAAQERRLSVANHEIDQPDGIYAGLVGLLAEADVLLALPDAKVFSAATLPNILLSTFRVQRPVIGFSSYYVRAGALAAVYSTPAQLGRQTGEIASRWLADGSLPRPQFPRYFSVSVNDTVARSLDIRLPDEAAILQRLRQAETDS